MAYEQKSPQRPAGRVAAMEALAVLKQARRSADWARAVCRDAKLPFRGRKPYSASILLWRTS